MWRKAEEIENARKVKRLRSSAGPTGRYASNMAATSRQAHGAWNVSIQHAGTAARGLSCRRQTRESSEASTCAKNVATLRATTSTAGHPGSGEARTRSCGGPFGIARTAASPSAITRDPRPTCRVLEETPAIQRQRRYWMSLRAVRRTPAMSCRVTQQSARSLQT